MAILAHVFQALSVMVLTIAVLLGGGYLALLFLDWGLQRKAGRREGQGLAQLWLTTVAKPKQVLENGTSDEAPQNKTE